jgi:hypothetical protein
MCRRALEGFREVLSSNHPCRIRAANNLLPWFRVYSILSWNLSLVNHANLDLDQFKPDLRVFIVYQLTPHYITQNERCFSSVKHYNQVTFLCTTRSRHLHSERSNGHARAHQQHSSSSISFHELDCRRQIHVHTYLHIAHTLYLTEPYPPKTVLLGPARQSDI